jgi:cytochrome-b5 reductase
MLARQSLRGSSAFGAAVVGGGTAYAAYADAPPGPKKIFPASGFVDFRLESSEMVNHNVKRLRFELPDKDAVTGMQPICT